MLVLVGKTGVGKDTVCRKLVDLGLHKIVRYTTRPKRDREVDGVDYHFITNEEFLDMLNGGKLEEWEKHITKQGVWYYGSSHNWYSNDNVIILSPQALGNMRNRSECCITYLMCDEDIVAKRLKNRGDDVEEVKRRIESDRVDFFEMEQYATYTIANDGSLNPDLLADIIYHAYYGWVQDKIERGCSVNVGFEKS